MLILLPNQYFKLIYLCIQIVHQIKLRCFLFFQMKKQNAMFVVQRILSHRQAQSGRFEYKIKWKGYPESQCTWEPLSHLTQIQQMVNDYYQQFQVKRISDAVWAVPQQEKKKKKEKKQKKQKRNQPNSQTLKIQAQIDSSKQVEQKLQKFPKLYKLLQLGKPKNNQQQLDMPQKIVRTAKRLASRKIRHAITQQRAPKPKRIKKIKKTWRQVGNCVILDSSEQQNQNQPNQLHQKTNRKQNLDSQQENVPQNQQKQGKYPSTSLDNNEQQIAKDQQEFHQQKSQSSDEDSSSVSSSQSSKNQMKVKRKVTTKWSISYYPHESPPSNTLQKLKEGNIFKNQIKKIQNIRKQDGQWKVYVFWKESKYEAKWVNRNLVRLVKPKMLLKYYRNLHQKGDIQSIRKIKDNQIITKDKTKLKKWIF